MSSTDSSDIWSETAPEYMREGKLYASVTYDNNGEPDHIVVARDQLNLGTFDVDDRIATVDNETLPTTTDVPTDEAVEYVEQLPFVDEVRQTDD